MEPEESTIAKLTRLISSDMCAQLNGSSHFPRMLVHLEMMNMTMVRSDFEFMYKAGMFHSYSERDDFLKVIEGWSK